MDREKVIKGLKIHSQSMHLNNCNECPYDNCEEENENGDYEGDCTFCLTNDALELLKEQQHTIWELQETNEYLEDKADRMMRNLQAVLEEREET